MGVGEAAVCRAASAAIGIGTARMTTPQPPNLGQVSLVIGAAGLFVLSGAASLARAWHPNNALRLAAKSLSYWAICLALGALIWHCANRNGWLPLEDNFEALTALGVM